jgi:hypothetical protein
VEELRKQKEEAVRSGRCAEAQGSSAKEANGHGSDDQGQPELPPRKRRRIQDVLEDSGSEESGGESGEEENDPLLDWRAKVF